MTAALDLSHFGLADAAALGLLILGWLGSGLIIDHPPARHPSVVVLMAAYRREWMRQFVTREPRIFDAAIVDSLRQGTSFFASAVMIAIGGGVALIGNAERLVALAEALTLAPGPVVVWEVRIILVLLFLTNAFLKFVWANRLFGYCAIVMAAVPNRPEDPMALPRAAQAAEINISAARSFNRGLRSVYFALAALAWLLGAPALALAALITIAVLLRREFTSRSRRTLIENLPH